MFLSDKGNECVLDSTYAGLYVYVIIVNDMVRSAEREREIGLCTWAGLGWGEVLKASVRTVLEKFRGPGGGGKKGGRYICVGNEGI